VSSYGTKIFIVVLALIAALAMQNWRQRHYDYQCESCGQKFNLPAWKDVLAVHMLAKKYVKCPKCGRWGWVRPVPKTDEL
jgi:DNA-directed RNA polymerase subunit RPC12/RpoP